MVATKEQKAKTFKPVFLFSDDKQINENLKLYKEWCKYLQDALDSSQSLFDEPLTDQEAEQILANGFDKVVEFLKEKLLKDLPQKGLMNRATPEFIFDMIGLDPYPVRAKFNFAPARFSAIKAEVKGGKVVISEQRLQDLHREHEHHTANEKQNKALEGMQEVCDILNDLKEENIISGFKNNGIALSKAFPLLTVEGDQICVDKSKIKQIN